jgi:hypothetical protein
MSQVTNMSRKLAQEASAKLTTNGTVIGPRHDPETEDGSLVSMVSSWFGWR